MEQNFLCACGNKLKCEGICKDTNLFRKRKTAKRCSAAYHKVEKRQKENRKE